MRHGRFVFSPGVLAAAAVIGGWWALDARSTGVLEPAESAAVGVTAALGILGLAGVRAAGQRLGSARARAGSAPTRRIALADWLPRGRSLVSALGGVAALLAVGLTLLALGITPTRALLDPVTGSHAIDFALGHVARVAVAWGLLSALPVPGTDVGQWLVTVGSVPWVTRVQRVAVNGVAAAAVLASTAVRAGDAWEWFLAPIVIVVASATWWRRAATTVDLTEPDEAGRTTEPAADVLPVATSWPGARSG